MKNQYFNEIKTRGQRPHESQKAVIIDIEVVIYIEVDMMKSVGEIASKIWPVA